MKMYSLSIMQLGLASLLIGVSASGVNALNSLYQEQKLLPLVELSAEGECKRVLNYANGHAFNCNDYNVTLRQYRVLTRERTANRHFF